MITHKTHKQENYKKHYLKARPFGLADILIILVMFSISIVFIVTFMPSTQGEYLEVYHNGNMIEKIDLNKNKIYTFSIDGEIILEVKNRTAYIISNNCHAQTCVKIPPISKVGERIICAPKKFVVVVSNNEDMFVTG